MNRHELTDEQWSKLAPILPPQRTGRKGRPSHPHRRILNGILWILNTGAPWRDLPERYGSWKTVSNRLYRWQKQGIWLNLLKVLQQQADAQGRLDWRLHQVDSTVIRAHQHAAGARGGQANEALGRSRGGFTTKLHVRIEGKGRPMAVLLTAGQQHDSQAFVPLMTEGDVKREGRGRPRSRPRRVVADKAYNSQHIRHYLHEHHIGIVIPRKSNQRRASRFDRVAYRERNLVERFINRLKQFCRVATRYEKRATNYLAMILVASLLLWL
jgi:transposase